MIKTEIIADHNLPKTMKDIKPGQLAVIKENIK